MRDLPINRVMTINPATVAPDDPADEARALLASGNIHHLPVVQDGILAGIVSSADFLKLYLLEAGNGNTAAAKVRHIMQKDPVTLNPNASLRDAAQRLSAGGFHALPVISADKTLVGIVTSGDVLEYVLQQLPRGDGSLRPGPAANTGSPGIREEELRSAIKAAEASLQSGQAAEPVDRALVFMHQLNRAQAAACQAAELYLRSGNGEHEHSVLIKCLAALRSGTFTAL